MKSSRKIPAPHRPSRGRARDAEKKARPVKRDRPTALAPLALTSDGALVFNAAEFQDDTSPETLLRVAMATGLELFIGIIVPSGHRPRLDKDIDDAAAELASRVGSMLVRPERR